MVDSEKPGALRRRMFDLGLNPEAIVRTAPDLFDRLERRCALCAHQNVCVTDLSQRRPDWWTHCCPNAVLLTALTEVWWFRELV